MSMGRIKTEASSWGLQLLLLLLQFDIIQNIIIFEWNKKDDKNGDIWDKTKWDVLGDLVSFVPFRKLKVRLLLGWLPRFLNCTNGTGFFQ